MSGKPDYLGMVRTQVRLFYCCLVVIILIPIGAWFSPWLPAEEAAAEFFQRSGSALLAIGLIAELAAVRVYSILNPSGYVSLGYAEAGEKYGKYPARMTYTVLVAVAIGTMISGYGDIFYNNRGLINSFLHSKSEEDVMFVTVISGVVIFVVGQILLKFVIEPVHELKGEIGSLENTFLRISKSSAGFTVDENTAAELKNHCANILTSRRKVPFFNRMHKGYGVPSHDDIDFGVVALKTATDHLEKLHADMREKGENVQDLGENHDIAPLFQQAGNSLKINVTYKELYEKVVRS